MAITYTYRLKSLESATERINKQEFPNTIRAVIWDLVGTDENGNTKELKDITTFLQFKTRNTGSFIPYSTLGEDDVVNFIKSVNNVEEFKGSIERMFAVKEGVEPEASLVQIMPWYFNGKTSISGSSI
jgi:hypothetical protein